MCAKIFSVYFDKIADSDCYEKKIVYLHKQCICVTVSYNENFGIKLELR